MKNASKKFYYLFLSVIFQTLSVLSMKFYLSLFKDNKSHPYILTIIYFITYLLFIIIFYSGLPKKKNEKNKNNLPNSIFKFRKRVNSIKLYKRNSIITIDSEEQKKEKHKKEKEEDKKESCNQCPNYYCIKNEVIYPSILLSIGHGMNIYTLGKINLIFHQMINGSILICFFRLLKSKEITKIKPNKVIAAIIDIFSIISFIIYHLYVSSGFELSYLFFILLCLFSSSLLCFAKYYNFSTIHRYSINFISNNIRMGEKKDGEEHLVEKCLFVNHGINNTDDEENNSNENEEEEDTNSNGDSSEENDNNNGSKKKKDKNQYFSYEKIIFYEGAICFCFWSLLVFITSFIKCPTSNNSFIKLFICNNCTTISGYESFFDSKEMIIFNNVQYKNKLVQYIYNYPLFSIMFIIIIIVTEFFYHFSFQKIFQGKYKTKLVVLLNPIVALIIFGIGYFGNKYSGTDSFLNQILPNILSPSEFIVCLSLFLGSIVTYLRLFEMNCKI